MKRSLVRHALTLAAAALAVSVIVPVQAGPADAAPLHRKWSSITSSGLRAASTPSPPARATTGEAVDRTNLSFTASNGRSSRYHIYAAGVPQPAGLVLQFHGDGAYEFTNPTSRYSLGGSSGIVAQARSRGYITVPVLSPDKSGSITWWEEGEANAVYVRDLLAHLKKTHGIKNDDIWLVGYSGGAQFITKFYLPAHSSTISGGGAVVFGGGGAPRSTRPFADSFRGDFPIHWYTGALDDGTRSADGYNALRDAQRGKAWYAGRGFATSAEHPAGVAHGLSGRFGRVVAQQLDAH